MMPELQSRTAEFLHSHAGACVTIAIALIGLSGGAIGYMMSHEVRHSMVEADVVAATKERAEIRETVKSIERLQVETLAVSRQTLRMVRDDGDDS